MREQRVFLDVGGHTGETLVEAMKPEWGFDRVWSFEPVAECVAALEAVADDRVTVVPAGWWSANTEMTLNNPGGIDASIETIEGSETSERCRFIDAAEWMAENITTDDLVWLKVNIEASEIEVLDRLLVTGEIAKIDHLVVHFDVEKFGRHDEAESMRRRLDEAGVPWRDASRVMFGRTVAEKTAAWLARTEGRHLQFGVAMLEHKARERVWRSRKWVRRHLRTR